jgi:hypothetical protein
VNGGGASVVIPDFALLYNDFDPDGQTITVTAAGSASGGSVTLAGDNVTFIDANNDGGSFVYTGSSGSPVLSDTGSVAVDRDQNNEGTLDGTGLDEILIGRDGADTIVGYEGDDVLIGNGDNDLLYGGTGNDLVVGGAGNDQFRLRSITGTDIIRDYADNADKIGFLDAGNNNNGSVNFAGVVADEAGVALTAGINFDTRAAITGILAADDQQVVRITTAQTAAQITTGMGAAGTNLYVFVFNSTTGRGEIWFDSNWSNVGSRVKVATLGTVTTLAQLNAITETDIVVYSNAVGSSAPVPPPPSPELAGDPPPPLALVEPALATIAGEGELSSTAANGLTSPDTTALETTSGVDSSDALDSSQIGFIDPVLANADGGSEGEPSSPAANGMTGVAATTTLESSSVASSSDPPDSGQTGGVDPTLATAAGVSDFLADLVLEQGMPDLSDLLVSLGETQQAADTITDGVSLAIDGAAAADGNIGTDITELIADYTQGQDPVDLSEVIASLISGAPTTGSEADAVINLSNDGTTTTISIDTDGTGAGTTFAEVATFNGVVTQINILFDDSQQPVVVT